MGTTKSLLKILEKGNVVKHKDGNNKEIDKLFKIRGTLLNNKNIKRNRYKKIWLVRAISKNRHPPAKSGNVGRTVMNFFIEF